MARFISPVENYRIYKSAIRMKLLPDGGTQVDPENPGEWIQFIPEGGQGVFDTKDQGLSESDEQALIDWMVSQSAFEVYYHPDPAAHLRGDKYWLDTGFFKEKPSTVISRTRKLDKAKVDGRKQIASMVKSRIKKSPPTQEGVNANA